MLLEKFYEDSRWFFGGGGFEVEERSVSSGFVLERHRPILSFSERSEFLRRYVEMQTSTHRINQVNHFLQDFRERNVSSFIISVILATRSASLILFDAVLHITSSKTCEWHTPNSSSLYLFLSPLSSSTELNTLFSYTIHALITSLYCALQVPF